MSDEPNQNQPQQPPLNPDLAGYPTVEALVNAYRASGAEGKRQRERAEQLEQQLQAALVENPRAAIPQRNGGGGNTNHATPNPYDQLSEVGVPTEALREAIRAEVRQEFEPISRGFQARGRMIAQHPDYTKFEADVAAFVQSDPELNQTYNRLFAADPVGAFEYAFLKFGDSRRRESRDPNQGTEEDRAHAAIPSNRSGDSRRAPNQDDAVAAAFKRFQETGSSFAAREYAKARLRGVITDEFLMQ